MDEWQIEALRLYNAGNGYRTIANHLMFEDKSFNSYDEAYQKVRKFIYKCRLRHPELITANIASDKKIVEASSQGLLDNSKEEVHQKRNADGTYTSERLIKIIEADLKDDKFLLEAHGFDADKYDIVNATSNFWSMNSADEERVNCQSKITVKPKVSQGITLKDIDEHFNAMAMDYFSIYPCPFEVNKNERPVMAELNLADLHYGKLAWSGECGANYDHVIARDAFKKIINATCNALNGMNIEYITFVWCNDYFNADNEAQTTVGGTPQDCDTRAKKMFNGGVDMLVWAIDMLSKIAPVRTFYLRDNHADTIGYYALQYINAWFRNNENVQVDIDAYPRKYILYGTTLLGYAHGADEKGIRLSTVPPLEARELWSKSKTCEMHTAHLHSEQERIYEGNGVIVRRIASPTGSDSWHVKSGFIGAVRKAQLFIYDKEYGNIQITNIPV